MFLPKSIRNQLLEKCVAYDLPDLNTHLYNPITVGKASSVTIGTYNKVVSAFYCKLGDFSKLTYSEHSSIGISYPIIAVTGGNFCDVTVDVHVDFSHTVKDSQTGLPETFVNMEDFPVLGITGDSFLLHVQLRKGFPYLKFTAHPATEEMKFYMNGELVAALPAGHSLDYISIPRHEAFAKELRAAIRKAEKIHRQEGPQIERISA